jgi:hypothetical protein
LEIYQPNARWASHSGLSDALQSPAESRFDTPVFTL